MVALRIRYSPNHIRFGLKPILAGPIVRVSLLNELLYTGVMYLLAKTMENARRLIVQTLNKCYLIPFRTKG